MKFTSIILYVGVMAIVACTENNSTPTPEKYPTISSFTSIPSDQFIISNDDLLKVTRANPFMGASSDCPHTGAHLHFMDIGYDYTINIYSPVNGTIHRITPCLDLENGNDKYEIDIAFATSKSSLVLFCISLEPFAGRLCESNQEYYNTYIHVEEGEEVIKGQVIGKLYKKGKTSDDTHIHFMLKREPGETFHCPNIFTSEISSNVGLLFGNMSCSGTILGTVGFCYQPATGEDLTGL